MKPDECAHEDFGAEVKVTRMEDTGCVIADITIKCSQCGEPFRFLGCPDVGLAWNRPSVSVNELELHAPIEPQGDPKLRMAGRFEMPPAVVRH